MNYDLIVIGAGPAGYAAAIRAAQLGMKVACMDDWIGSDGAPALGGTCLNVGCIPSKVLLEVSQTYSNLSTLYPGWGIAARDVALDIAAMMAHKQRIVTRMTQGIAALFRANGVHSLCGRGRLIANRAVEFTPRNASADQSFDQKPQIFHAEHVILAAGSKPVELAVAPLHENLIVDSSGALAFDAVPARLGVIGGGVIGLELGSVWRRLGAQVVVLEAQKDFLSACDRQIAREALRQFRAEGLDIRLGARVTHSAVKQGKVELGYQDDDGSEHVEMFDRLIVAVGREPSSDGLCVREAGLLIDEWGFVHVDAYCLSSVPGVYAVGDLVRGPMLAHKGAQEGVMVVERIAGQNARVNYDTIPSIIYTQPEIASVGATEQAIEAEGIAYQVGVFPFAANARAHAQGDASGFVKVIADAATDRVLGVHMIGPGSSELIASAVLAMEFGASSEDISLTMFAHPTLSEALHEAALAVQGHALHVAKAKK
ncbi:MAG: dihydrolipoyl dehydrogenase [Chromatiales bacterium]|jgi:dihydrolipoamide dehydrogenase|nr:dihydrolipoyl dehydrogenase [Chromatiales bacterium]